MSWSPNAGTWGKESFDNSSGATFTTNNQAITGGYVTLLPDVVSSSSYVSSWLSVTGWSFTHDLASLSSITGSFILQTGSVHTGQTVTTIQESIFSAGAWQITTPQPSYDSVSGTYSGQGVSSLLLGTGSPDTTWSTYFTGGGETVTIEFDVSSTTALSGVTPLSGFSSIELSGLPSISGRFLNHGVYIDVNSTWEYIEISPYGIQLANHPEIAIPLDLATPKRIRIGIRDSDIYIASEDGRSVAGLGKFDTSFVPPENEYSSKIEFGAPHLSAENNQIGSLSSRGIVGTSLWKDIKIITGELIINTNSGQKQSYSTSGNVMYTAEFDPVIGINSYNYAVIDYLPYNGGTTTVVAQYSGISGWEDSSASSTLPTTSSTTSIDLTDIPVYSYPREDLGQKHTSNPIRFKITQASYGISPPPAVSEITIFASKEKAYLDILPNWKLMSEPSLVKLGIQQSEFRYTDPAKELWSTFLFNAPTTLGDTYSLTEEALGNTISVTGRVIQGGRYKTAFQNFTLLSGIAVSGSDAASYFGYGNYVNNFFHNYYLDNEFTPVEQESSYVTGRVFGHIADGLDIPGNYTGLAIVNYLKTPVTRPSRNNLYYNYRPSNFLRSTDAEYAQTVYIPANTFSGEYQGNEGIEVIIPSGIVTSSILFSFDVKINSGSGLFIYATGDVVGSPSYSLTSTDGNLLSFSFPVETANTGQVALGFVMKSGEPSSSSLSFLIDNISCSPYIQSSMICTGVPTYIHNTGTVDYFYSGNSIAPDIASTVFYGDFFLNNYPEQTGILFEKRRTSDGKGFSLSLTNEGELIVSYDMLAKTFSTSGATSLSAEVDLGSRTLTGRNVIPIGEWLNIGFIHQVDTYDYLSDTAYSGQAYPYNFASTNRSLLTLNGLVLESVDEMKGWPTNSYFNSNQGDPAPYVSYIADGDGTITMASGLFCLLDGIHLKKSVKGSAEVDLSIKGDRSYVPYFVPDKYLKPNTVLDNPLIEQTGYHLGDDLFIGSIYNFSNPGYRNWDHGPLGNHLLFFNTVTTSLTGGPYNLGYTRFEDNAYALAPYSSSFDRLINTTGALGITTSLSSVSNSGNIEVIGWVNPHSTGEFLSIVEDTNYPGSGAIAIGFNPSMNLEVTRRLDNGTSAWVYTTTTISGELDNWNYYSFRFGLSSFTGIGNTGSYSVEIQAGGFTTESYSQQNLVNAGFQYYGRSGTSKESAIYIGRGSDVSVCDWAINPYNVTGTRDITFMTGDKGGRYNTVLQNFTPVTSNITWPHFYTGELFLGPTTSENDRLIWVSTLGGYDNSPRLNGGMNLFDDEIFREVMSYSVIYDDSKFKDAYGSTDSPIRILTQVPKNAINLAKISSPPFSLLASVSTIDLSDTNQNNLASYKDGTYTIQKSNGIVTSTEASGNYKGINDELYTNRVDVLFSGEVYSNGIKITTISATDINLENPTELYYSYLIGRARLGVYVSDAYPHQDGTITEYTTGSAVTSYIENLERVRDKIKILKTDGSKVDYNTYPYDIIVSPYNPDGLDLAVLSGIDVDLERVNHTFTTEYSGVLPDKVFSVLLLVPDYPENESYWVSYPAFDYDSETIIGTKLEVINPIKICRESPYYLPPVAGTYRLSLDENTNQTYNLKFYGMTSGYSGVF